MGTYVEPTPESLSICLECFGLTSTAANLHKMTMKDGLRFHRTLDYLREHVDCKMCCWILQFSDLTLWEHAADSLDIGIQSHRANF
jgi:hypothetical protein